MEATRLSGFYLRLASLYFIALFFIGGIKTTQASALIQGQQINYKQFKGQVIDKDTKKGLAFATLSVENSNISTITNSNGDFTLKIPHNLLNGSVNISFLGYSTKRIAFSELDEDNSNTIMLNVSATPLEEVHLSIPKDPAALVEKVMRNKGKNYLDSPTIMKAFYRETIKKRRRNVSLAEAVVNIHKASYASLTQDQVQLDKVRKSTDYSKLDTMALKLKGGPFNNLFVDLVKYSDIVFAKESLLDYNFTYDKTVAINNTPIYVINFEQKKHIATPLYEGQLFIDPERNVLTRAIYSLNIKDGAKAAEVFVRKKPKHAKVTPMEISYKVDYQNRDGKWFYSYSNLQMAFKINWDKKLFNSVYVLNSEMAITDWKWNTEKSALKRNERV
ncbi:MAG: carboxypeptidase-like regulatory domain-containing protein, partial [Flavobacteriaceae bacterium]